MANTNEKAMNRRDFLRGAAATAAAAGAAAAWGCAPQSPAASAQGDDALAGTGAASESETAVYTSLGDVEFFEPTGSEVSFVADPIADDEIAEVWDCDVLVCGAGIAGLSAAASAAENGLKVILVEKGSTVPQRGNDVCGFGSQLMERLGYHVDRQSFFNEAMLQSAYRADGRLWNRYMDFSGAAVDWLDQTVLAGALGEGFLFNGTEDRIQNGINWRPTGIGWGSEGMAGVNRIVCDYVVSHGGDVHFDTPACQLVQGSDGAIEGAIVESVGSYVKVNASKGVVLATGGYEANFERLKRFIHPRELMVAAWADPVTTCMGDGHEMGRAVGAAEDDYPHCTMNEAGGTSAVTHQPFTGAMFEWLRVNEDGLRFVNEALILTSLGVQIEQQQGGHAFVILSGDMEKMIDAMKGPAPFETAPLVESLVAGSVQADTLEELADKIGVNRENLVATVERYNELVAKGVDEDFNKSADKLFPIDEPPYYAFEEMAQFMVTASGLKVTEYSEVVSEEGAVIPGLYALGNASGGMFWGTYPHNLAGVSHGRGVVFGYLLGRRLAGIED